MRSVSRTASPSYQDILRPFQRLHRLPFLRLDPGVAGFAVIDFAEQNPAFRPLPAFVRANGFLRAVCVGDMQGGDQPAGLTQPPLLVLAVQPARHGRTEPAPAHRHAQVILLPQQRRHVIGLHLQAVIIAGPARSQHKIPHLPAVDLREIDPERGDLQLRLPDGFSRGNLFAEHRAYIAGLL